MFLAKLSSEQKELFYGLAKKAAEANGVVEEAEKDLLDAYASEMGLQYTPDVELDYMYILEKLKSVSTCVELNQIAFEIVGMIMSDSEYDDKEKQFMNQLFVEFDISSDKVDRMFQCLNEYTQVVRKINMLMYD